MSRYKGLDSLRKQIDAIDDDILALISRRGKVALEISKYKQQGSLNIYDPGREKEIESKMQRVNNGPLCNERVVSIFREIVLACRELQEPKEIGYLGPQGSFSNQAAVHKFSGSCEMIPLVSFEEIFKEVYKRTVDFGIVPIENSVEGSIGSVLDSLLTWDLHICSEYLERISHTLMSKSGKLEDIKSVASHPQALGQCRNWLACNLKQAGLVETISSAAAAKIASEDSAVAAIASDYASSIYNLKVVRSRIEDSDQNTTRFLVIGHQESPITGEDKTSLAFAIKDEPGALYRALFLPLADEGINLTKIESRPSKNRPWEYIFFVDFLGHYTDEKIREIIKRIEKECIFLKILGSYPAAKMG